MERDTVANIEGIVVGNRLSILSKKSLALSILLPALFIGLLTWVGLYGPPVLIVRSAGIESIGIDFSDSLATTCSIEPDGRARPSMIPRCWSHYFVFTSRWTQYFDVILKVQRPSNIPTNEGFSSSLAMQIEWWGLSEERGWVPVFNGNVTRPVRCWADGTCWPMVAFRTSSVSYETYFARLRIPDDVPDAAVQNAIGPATDVVLRYRNPDFAIWELGHKVFFMLVSIGWAAWYMAGTGCNLGMCRRAMRCCRGGVDGRTRSAQPLGFHEQARVNWMYALLMGLVAYNQPLLWAAYYAPYDYVEKPVANGVPFLNVACQLTFIALLLAYWIVEFGLLAATANAALQRAKEAVGPASTTSANGAIATNGSSDVATAGDTESSADAPDGGATVPASVSVRTRAKRSDACIFYTPKLTAIAVYWLMAVALYGHILSRMQGDPLYDWIAEGTSAASGAGSGTIDTKSLLVAWTAIMAGGYLLYLLWLGTAAACSCRTMSGGERFLFGFHALVILVTCIGLAGSTLYGADATSPADFNFFNALYNVYVWTMAWLYAPRIMNLSIPISIPAMGLPPLGSMGIPGVGPAYSTLEVEAHAVVQEGKGAHANVQEVVEEEEECRGESAVAHLGSQVDSMRTGTGAVLDLEVPAVAVEVSLIDLSVSLPVPTEIRRSNEPSGAAEVGYGVEWTDSSSSTSDGVGVGIATNAPSSPAALADVPAIVAVRALDVLVLGGQEAEIVDTAPMAQPEAVQHSSLVRSAHASAPTSVGTLPSSNPFDVDAEVELGKTLAESAAAIPVTLLAATSASDFDSFGDDFVLS